MNSTLGLLFCTVILFSAFVSLGVSEVHCRSYGGQNGECVELPRCPPLLAVILSKEKTTEHIKILQQLTCLQESTTATDPVVCCPLGEIVSSSYLPKEILEEQQQPSTTKAPETTQRTYIVERVPPSLSWGSQSVVTLPSRRRTTPPPEKESGRATGEAAPLNGVITDEASLLRRKFTSLIPPLANCSLSDVTGSRIIGGTTTDHGQYPWMARLGYRSKRTRQVEYYCGGVVINKRYILTAAHCTYGYDDNFELVHVRLGEHNTKTLTDCSDELGTCSVPENFGVENVVTHEQYNTVTKHNDIALVRVSRDIQFQTYFVKPVCLPFMSEYGLPEPKSLNSLTGTVIGWGRTNWTKSEGSTTLQQVRLPIVTTEKCVKDFRNRVNITPEQLCAGGERTKDSCGGDSGGPLMIDRVIGTSQQGRFDITRKFQYGIVSYGPVKCGIGIPGVYTRITEYLTWILKNIQP